MERYLTKYIDSNSANSTVTIEIGSFVTFGYITIGTTSAQALTFKDANGNTIGLLKASIAEGTYWFSTEVQGKLQVVIPASYTGTATIGYR